MPEIVPFGKYNGNSVEQVALKDYKYFLWLKDTAKKPSLRDRLEFVDHVLNNFVSVEPCALDDCEEPARLISVYQNFHMRYRGSSMGFIYCSRDHFEADPYVTDERHKASLEHLTFRTAFSRTKTDTNNLVQVIAKCMGMKEERKTKEYLEEFIDNVTLPNPYTF